MGLDEMTYCFMIGEMVYALGWNNTYLAPIWRF